MGDTPRKRKVPRKIKVVLWAAGVALTYTLAGFFLLPAIIKSQMLKRLPALTKRQAAVSEVTFNPFTFALAVRGLSLKETNGDDFAGFEGFHLQFQALSSLHRRTWVFQDVTLTHPFLRVIRQKDGTFNFGNLLETNAPAPAPAKPVPPSALPAVVIESLHVDGASLQADDLSSAQAFHDKLTAIDLQSAPLAIMLHAASPFLFSASTDADEKFTVSGKITVQPFQILGNVTVAGLDLKRYAPYLAAFTTARLAGGKVDVGADYQVGVGPAGFDASLTHATVKLTDLNVKSPDASETVLSIPILAVQVNEASLGKKMVHVGSIKSSGGSLLVRQDHDGKINLLSMFPAGPSQPAPAPPSAPAAPWVAQVDEIAFDGYSVSVEDQKPSRPVKLDLSALAFSVKGFNSAVHAPLATTVSMRLNGQGSLSLNGTVSPPPVSGDLALDLEGLDLPAFAPYIPSQVRLVLNKGQLNIKGQARGAMTPNGPTGSFTGDVSLRDFATADAAHDRNLVKFDALTVTGIKASYPLQLQAGEVSLAGLNANLIVDTNRRLNLLTIVTPAPSSTASAPKPSSEPLPSIDLGALVIDKASLHFVDESIEPHATLDVQELSGSVKKLSTHPQGPATVSFQGRVDPFSPYSISGSVDPLARELSLDLAVSLKNLDLTPMTPYMEKYGGYPLNRGKLLLQLKYDIARRKLVASNKVVVGDLTLGQRNDSTNATHLPIKLGIALLKDRDRNIDLDIPVSGNLDDPQFRIMPIILQTVRNLLARAAASPFNFLGKVLGGGVGDELSFVDFTPGNAALAQPESAKLKKLAKALYERPELALQIAGACAPAADGAALAREHLRRRIRKMRAEELAAAGQPMESVESIKLAPADYARLTRTLYEKTYGPIDTNQAGSVSTNLPPPAASPPTKETPKSVHRNWFSSAYGHVVKYMQNLAGYQPKPAPPPAQVAAAPKPAAPAQPPPEAPPGPDLARMEQRLAADIKVTDDELRELMQARAKAVQADLLASGQIAAGRVFIVAPKPINPAAAGETRAHFSLE